MSKLNSLLSEAFIRSQLVKFEAFVLAVFKVPQSICDLLHSSVSAAMSLNIFTEGIVIKAKYIHLVSGTVQLF